MEVVLCEPLPLIKNYSLKNKKIKKEKTLKLFDRYF